MAEKNIHEFTMKEKRTYDQKASLVMDAMEMNRRKKTLPFGFFYRFSRFSTLFSLL